MPRTVSRPPYAPAEALVRFIRRIPDARVPDEITAEYLAEQDLGAGAGNERHLVSALRFLGLINQRGQPTDAFRALSVPARQREVLRELLRASYRPIFAAGPVEGLTRDEAESRFTTAYGVAGQIREKAIRCFAALCDLAEIPLAPDFLQRRRSRRPGGRGRRAAPALRRARAELGAEPRVVWSFAITIPPELSEDEMVRYLRRVTRALHRLQREGLGDDADAEGERR
jgi:hypothetical protein